MKVERKKAREEIDVVNVIEWQSPDSGRFFILVRRPEKGLHTTKSMTLLD